MVLGLLSYAAQPMQGATQGRQHMLQTSFNEGTEHQMAILNPFRHLARRWSRPDHRGQSLVELAITLPLLLLMVVGAIDLGRAYFRVENLTNAVKEGAFFGARRPTCDTNLTPGCPDPRNVQYRVTTELDSVNFATFSAKCFAAGTTDFTTPGKALADCEDGDLYYVHATVLFDLITPIISDLVGNQLTLSSSATSVVLTDFDSTGDVGFGTPVPTPTPSVGQCTVPSFLNGTKINQAQGVWNSVGGFTTTVTTIGPAGQAITWQSRPQGYVGPCSTTTITVSNTAQATPTPSPTPSATPSGTPTPTPSSSSSSTATPTPTPTPQANCIVPQLVTNPKKAVTQAQAAWSAAGFLAANFSAVRPPNNDYNVASQSLTAGLSRPCLTTTIQVDN